jgi:hypothetical protein
MEMFLLAIVWVVGPWLVYKAVKAPQPVKAPTIDPQLLKKWDRDTEQSDLHSHKIVLTAAGARDFLFYGSLTACRDHMPTAVIDSCQRLSDCTPRKGPVIDSVVLSSQRGYRGMRGSSGLLAIVKTKP